MLVEVRLDFLEQLRAQGVVFFLFHLLLVSRGLAMPQRKPSAWAPFGRVCAILLLLALSVASSCGVKGPLKLPEAEIRSSTDVGQ